MRAFGKLPFQFQQRGEQVAAAASQAASDPRLLSQHLTKRDQDLEDYLATLKGARVSEASFLIPNTTVVAGSGPQVLPLSFVAGIGGLEHADTAGFVPLDSSVTAVICVSGVEAVWSNTAGTTAGMAIVFASIGAASMTDFVIPSATLSLTFAQNGTQIDQIPVNTPLSALSAVVQLTDALPDIVTSTGPMGGIGELSVSGAAFLYVVD